MLDKEINQINQAYQWLMQFLMEYSVQLIGALLILAVGVWLGHKVRKLIMVFFAKKQWDVTLANFIANAVKIAVVVMFAIIALGKIGISVTPFVAAIGAASLGAGLAFQGLLANYGAGFTIIVSRPFVVGDTIRVNGVEGKVKEITLAATFLDNEQGEEITVPNKHIVGEVLHNSFANTAIDNECSLTASHISATLLTELKQQIASIPNVATECPILVGINSLQDGVVTLGYRYWVRTEAKLQTQQAVNFAILQWLHDRGISLSSKRVAVDLSERA